jgi:hypothetical protein
MQGYNQNLNAFNLYTKSILHQLLNQKNEQINCLIKTLCKFPLHWSAWLELCKAVVSSEDMDHLEVLSQLPNHWMKNFYCSYIFNELIKIHPKYDQYSMGITYSLWVHFSTSIFL